MGGRIPSRTLLCASIVRALHGYAGLAAAAPRIPKGDAGGPAALPAPWDATFSRLAQESGIHYWERYISAENTPDWEARGWAWIQNGVDPDASQLEPVG